MRTFRHRACPVLIALIALAGCRDAADSLVGPPTAPSLAESMTYDRRGAAMDMNDSGVAAGWVLNTYKQERAFRWRQGFGLDTLGTLGGDMSRAVFINSSDHVAGISRTPDGMMHVFSWSAAGGMKDLGTLNGTDLTLTGFSDAGHVVGWGNVPGVGRRGFVAREGTPLQILNGLPTDVNAAGLVVGRENHFWGSPPFQWTASGGVQPLPAPWGAVNWIAGPLLNEAGVLAGTAVGSGTPVVLWSPSGGYLDVPACGVPCYAENLALNESGGVAWSRGFQLGFRAPDGTVRQTTVAVNVSRLLVNENGMVAGGGPTAASLRSFVWQPSGVGYYRTSSMVYALNDAGELAGVTDVGWKQQPARFGVPENHPPVANAGGPYEVLAGVPLTVNAGLSTDPDGDSLRVYWDGFHDPLCCWKRRPPVGWRPAATDQWNVPGEYTIRLSVSDRDSLFSHGTAQVRVLPNPGATMRYGPYSGVADGYILFDGRRDDDPTGRRYRYYWSFDYKYAPRAVVSTKYMGVGTTPVELVVRDSAGALVEHVYTQAVVTPRTTLFGAPRYLVDRTDFLLSLVYLPANQPAQEVSFDCGTGAFTAWVPAQQEISQRCAGLLEGTYELRARHRLSPAAPETVYSRSITVQNHQPGPVTIYPPSFARVGAVVSATVTFTDTPGDGPWLVYVNWGDGTVTQTTTSSGSATLTRTYTAAGSYNVHGFVRDRDGAGGQSSTKTIRIFP